MAQQLTCTELRARIKEFPNVYNPSSMRKNRLVEYYNALLVEQQRNIVRKSFQELKDVPIKVTPVTCVDQDWRNHLLVHGWATLPLMDNATVNYYADCYWEWLESLSEDFKRDDPTSWKNRPPSFNGIFRNYISHTEWVWRIRELCYPIFTHIWQSDDLIVSFDGGCFMPPAKNPIDSVDSIPYTPLNHWMHCDQPRKYKGMVCVQGVVNLLDNGPLDGGLLLVEKSKDIYDDYINAHPSEGIEYFHVDMTDPLLSDKRVLKVCAPAGHMLLWDSRMFHSNTKPMSNKPRMCTYVSMQLRSLATPKQLTERIKLYESGRGTGHWVGGEWFHARSRDAWSFGSKVIKPEVIEIAKLNDVRRKLIGY